MSIIVSITNIDHAWNIVTLINKKIQHSLSKYVHQTYLFIACNIRYDAPRNALNM